MGDVGIGAVLRDTRTEQGRSIADAAAATSMRSIQIEAMEDDRFEVFGGDVYAKGFLRSYATWLGLDPDPLVDRYRRYVEHDTAGADAHKLATSGSIASTESSELPMWLVRAVAVVGVLGLAVGLVQFVSARTPSPAEEPTIAEAPEPVSSSPSDGPDDGGADDRGGQQPASRPEPSPSPSYQGVELTLAFEDSSWISVRVDGQETQEGLFESGDALVLQGDEEVVVRFGNAGGVTALLNGERVGPFGDAGSVEEVRFTGAGAEPV